MTRFNVAVLLVLSFLLLLYSSCAQDPGGVNSNTDSIVAAEETARDHFRAFDIVTLEDLGEIHNEILSAFESLHPFTEGERLRRDEFVQVFLAAANEVMISHEFATTFSSEDIQVVLECFDGYSAEGVYDFCGQAESDPYVLLEYLYSKGELSDSEYHDYVAMYDGLYGRTPEGAAAARDISERTSIGARQVIEASRQFWSSHGPRTTPVVAPPKDGRPQLKTDWYSLGIVAADAMGAIITHRLLPVGSSQIEAMGAALASAAFIALAGGGDDPGGGDGSGGGGGGVG